MRTMRACLDTTRHRERTPRVSEVQKPVLEQAQTEKEAIACYAVMAERMGFEPMVRREEPQRIRDVQRGISPPQ